MGARRWGRAGGTSRTRSTVQARAAARSFLFRDHAPAVLLIIGLLLLTGALLAAAPSARAATGSSVLGEILFAPLGEPAGDTHTWDSEAGWEDQNWSTAKNWVDDSLPSNGDDLVFPDWMASNAINDDFLTAVGSVDLGMSQSAGGSAVTVAGLLFARGYDDWGSGWGCPTTLRDDTTISTVPTGNPTGAPFSIWGEVSLEDSFGVGHTLTVDPVDAHRVWLEGGLTGKGVVVKKGTGVLRLGGGGPGGLVHVGRPDGRAGRRPRHRVARCALVAHRRAHRQRRPVAADLWIR